MERFLILASSGFPWVFQPREHDRLEGLRSGLNITDWRVPGQTPVLFLQADACWGNLDRLPWRRDIVCTFVPLGVGPALGSATAGPHVSFRLQSEWYPLKLPHQQGAVSASTLLKNL